MEKSATTKVFVSVNFTCDSFEDDLINTFSVNDTDFQFRYCNEAF